MPRTLQFTSNLLKERNNSINSFRYRILTKTHPHKHTHTNTPTQTHVWIRYSLTFHNLPFIQCDLFFNKLYQKGWPKQALHELTSVLSLLLLKENTMCNKIVRFYEPVYSKIDIKAVKFLLSLQGTTWQLISTGKSHSTFVNHTTHGFGQTYYLRKCTEGLKTTFNRRNFNSNESLIVYVDALTIP